MTRLIYPRNNEIAYLEADVNYTIFYLLNGEKFVSSTTLKHHAAAESLRSFLRVHKSYLLNPEFIKSYAQRGRKAEIQLKNGKKVQVARRKISEVKGLLNLNLV